jgi:HAD superfamily hydrolase (TIGR01509 family)
MPSFDAILFDFDGVLADTEPLHWACWAETLKPLGLVLTWEYYSGHCIGIDDRDMLRMMAACADPPRNWEELWEQYPRKKELFRARTLAAPPFHPALGGFLGRLHIDYKLAVVSSSSRTEVEPLLVAGGLRGHFDALVCAEDVPRLELKPAPTPYLLAAERTGARHPLVVEDSAAGLASGRAAGFEVLPVAHAADLPELLERRLGRR